MTYKELKELVIKHCYLYYDLSSPEISDAEFDDMYNKLLEVEKAQGWSDLDSPTQKVGGLPGKVKHPYTLYSLKKIYDSQELDPSFDVKTPKIDGTNLTLIYKNGKLKSALTRGNGEYGDNVLHLALHIENIPVKINTDYSQLVINGECVTDNKVDNFRNYVSGALGLKHSTDFTSRNIKFIAHDWLGVSMNYTTRMTVVKNMGFTTVFDKVCDNYPQDGIVYRINSYSKSEEAGYTSKYPRFAVALKPRGILTATAVLQDVEWSIGRTGTVNPTGVISPVEIDGAIITRVTLHNIGVIEDNNLGIGDTIQIERAGGVIPKFLKVIEHSSHNIKITNAHAEKALNALTYRQGPKLMVIDKSLSNNSKLVEHFVKTLDIKGLGPASIKKLNIQHPSDIFNITNWNDLGANGSKIKSEIDKAKQKPYDLVLAALGIPGVGKSTAKLIVNKIPKFSNLKDLSFTSIKGIGPATIDSVLVWLEQNTHWVEQLPLQLEYVITVDELTTKVRKVCITGKMDISRQELTEVLEKKGFKVTSTVTKDCYALITDGESSSSKYVKAQQLGIRTLMYESKKKEILTGTF